MSITVRKGNRLVAGVCGIKSDKRLNKWIAMIKKNHPGEKLDFIIRDKSIMS